MGLESQRSALEQDLRVLLEDGLSEMKTTLSSKLQKSMREEREQLFRADTIGRSVSKTKNPDRDLVAQGHKVLPTRQNQNAQFCQCAAVNATSMSAGGRSSLRDLRTVCKADAKNMTRAQSAGSCKQGGSRRTTYALAQQSTALARPRSSSCVGSSSAGRCKA